MVGDIFANGLEYPLFVCPVSRPLALQVRMADIVIGSHIIRVLLSQLVQPFIDPNRVQIVLSTLFVDQSQDILPLLIDGFPRHFRVDVLVKHKNIVVVG